MRASNIVFAGILVVAVVLVVLLLLQQTAITPSEDIAGDIVDITVETAEETATVLSDFIDRLTQTPQSTVVRVLMIVGGVLLLLVGWRIYDYVVIVAGMIIGATIALSLLTTDDTVMTIGALLVGALIGAVLSIFLYYAAVFVIGAYIGIVLTRAIVDALSTVPASDLVLLIGAVLGGLVLLALSYEFLVLLSALVGAELLTLGLGLPAVWTLVFAILGVVIQLVLMRTYRYDFRRRPRRVFLT